MPASDPGKKFSALPDELGGGGVAREEHIGMGSR